MGGKSAPAPDYSAMERVANRQLDFAQRQYDEMKPILTGLANTMRSAQEQQMQQAQDYYNYQTETFRPLERGLVADATRFSTEGYREQQAREAAAAAGRAFSATEAANQRAMASMGVNPNSGRALAMRNQTNLGLAAQRAGAMTGARQQAEQMGWARRMDATGLGRNLAGASTAAYSGATSAGQAAGGMYQAPGATYMQGLSSAGQTQGAILNAQTSYANTVNQQADPFATIVGMGLGGWAGGGFNFGG